MIIIDRKTFLQYPAETVFSKYTPCVFGELCIKGDTIGNDFFYQDIVGSFDAFDGGEFSEILEDAQADGTNIVLDFDIQGRDGYFDDDQLFAVWGHEDVQALIRRLQRTLE